MTYASDTIRQMLPKSILGNAPCSHATSSCGFCIASLSRTRSTNSRVPKYRAIQHLPQRVLGHLRLDELPILLDLFLGRATELPQRRCNLQPVVQTPTMDFLVERGTAIVNTRHCGGCK